MLGAISSLKGSSGYKIPNSLRFRASNSAYLSKTPTVTGNRKTWTWSGWVKRGALSTGYIFNAGVTSDNTGILLNDALSSRLQLNVLVSSVQKIVCYTSSALRDPSAWYHIVVAVDTTQATNSDGVKMYVNGTQQTLTFSSYTQNIDTSINFTNIHYLANSNSSERFDGYLAEVNFIDGQALAPSAFGAISNQTGVWAPKAYTGTYGTNGFYLKFTDNSAATSAAIGKDFSGNNNNWTPNNISLIAGSTYDSMADSPTPYADALYYSGWNPNYGLQFTAADSSRLSRTPASLTNATTNTWSGWVKRTVIGTLETFWAAGTSIGSNAAFSFTATNQIALSQNVEHGGVVYYRQSNQTFTDLSKWYHITLVVDTTNSTAQNRARIWVDGAEITSWLTNATIPLNTTFYWNAAAFHTLGTNNSGSGALIQYFDGYLAEINFIDGQALDASSFGETIDGTWVPKTYSGTYGTNGFYLNFADRSAMTAAAIGNDASSNSNNWTPTNLVITDAIDYTAKSARGNYATLNPLNVVGSLSDANLKLTGTDPAATSTIAVYSGKWYAEFTHTAIGAQAAIVGITNNNTGAAPAGSGNSVTIHYQNIGVISNAGSLSSFTSWTVNDIIGVALDSNNGTISFYKNNVLITTVTNTSFIVGNYNTFLIGAGGTAGVNTAIANFGQRPFTYTPPTGFLALNTQNLPVPTIRNGALYTAATTYTGTGASRSISNTVNNKSFQPDLVWIKGRSGATDHALYDSVRGAQKDLVSNTNAAETTQATGLLSFDTTGATIGALAKLNTNAATYVAWQWKAGGTTASNTAGTITSQVNAGMDQGFSVVSYTGNGTAGATVGHGLGTTPSMIIARNRADTSDWSVYHQSLPESDTLFLNQTTISSTYLNRWAKSGFTSSVFKLGSNPSENNNGSVIAYCFAEVAGYSKFGSYTGNGSVDGPFVFCGFRPRWILFKSITGGTVDHNWGMFDATRESWNVCDTIINASISAAEILASVNPFDFVSNGFKIRGTGVASNTSGATYIFAAFAENPSKYALAR